ncbi:acyl transferase domain-containing protein [Melanogaster broomeanus]|nr:acyl transferase domain-containing protein [Melanogaster broomeanus]
MGSKETCADLARSIIAPTTTQKKQLHLFSIGSLTESALGRWKDALSTLPSVARDLGRQTRAYPSRAFAVASALDASAKFSKPVLTNSNANPKLCLVFAGQGPQHGQESVLERTGLSVPGAVCTLAANGVWPVQEIVLSLVFVQVALVDLVRSLGIQYEFVVGHSIGEIAMGYASGHYDREMAVGIAVAQGNGAMVALGVGVQKAKTMIRTVLARAKVSSGLWIAGINSPQAVTIAGTHGLVDAIVELTNDPDAKVFAAKLCVSQALFKERVAETPLAQGTKTPVARVMSTPDGKWLDRVLDINYCWDNIRCPVLFGTAQQTHR